MNTSALSALPRRDGCFRGGWDELHDLPVGTVLDGCYVTCTGVSGDLSSTGTRPALSPSASTSSAERS